MAYDHNTFFSEMSPEREKTFYLRESFARLLEERIDELAKHGWEGYADMYEEVTQNLYDVIRLACELLKIDEIEFIAAGFYPKDSATTSVSVIKGGGLGCNNTDIRLDELVEEAVKKADYLKLKAQFKEVE